VDDGVHHRLTKRLVRILRLVFPIEATNGCTDPDILPQEAAGLVDELGKRSMEIFRSM